MRSKKSGSKIKEDKGKNFNENRERREYIRERVIGEGGERRE